MYLSKARDAGGGGTVHDVLDDVEQRLHVEFTTIRGMGGHDLLHHRVVVRRGEHVAAIAPTLEHFRGHDRCGGHGHGREGVWVWVLVERELKRGVMGLLCCGGFEFGFLLSVL